MKLKQEQNIFHVVVNASSCISNQKWNKKTCQLNVNIIARVNNIMFGILAHVFVKIEKI